MGLRNNFCRKDMVERKYMCYRKCANKCKNLVKNSIALDGIRILFRYFGMNRVFLKGENNSLNISKAFLKKTKVKMLGDNNKVILDENTRLFDSEIYICGNKNLINISSTCTCRHLTIWIEDDNNECLVGAHCGFMGNDQLILAEGKKISIGSDCLIAYNVVLRTGDSHAIFDENSRRINNAKDISIGDKVWIADGVIVLKGAKIADSTIIGSNAVVTGKSFPSHTVIAGNPAKIVKENVTWTPERDA